MAEAEAVRVLLRTAGGRDQDNQDSNSETALDSVVSVGEALEVLAAKGNSNYLTEEARTGAEQCLEVVQDLLSHEDVLDEFVRAGVAAKLVSSLREGILERYSPAGLPDRSAELYHLYCVRCLACMGEYVECLGPILKDRGVEICLELLKMWRHRPPCLSTLLSLISSLLAHRKYACIFVEQGGVAALLDLPETAEAALGVSACLFGLSSQQEALELACGRGSEEECDRMARAAVKHASSGLDPCRRNAALFLAEALRYQRVVRCFDLQGGVAILLNLVRASQRFEGARSEAVLAYHLLCVLRSYFRSHLALLASQIHSQGHSKRGLTVNPAKATDMDAKSLSFLIREVRTDARAAVWLACETWPAAADFEDGGGASVLLHFAQRDQTGNYHSETVVSALEVLRIVTLSRRSHAHVAQTAPSHRRRSGSTQQEAVEALLDSAARYRSHADPKVASGALQVLVHLVCVPSALEDAEASCRGGRCLLASVGPAYERSRDLVRGSNGIRVLLDLLRNRCHDLERSREMSWLSLRALNGLARDPSIAQVLQRLQVPHLLSEMLRDPATRVHKGPGGGGFRAEALGLISSLTGSDLAAEGAGHESLSALHRIERHEVVRKTRIAYPQRELFLLMRDHLVAAGMHDTARSLEAEAKLGTAEGGEVEGGEGAARAITFPSRGSGLMANARPRVAAPAPALALAEAGAGGGKRPPCSRSAGERKRCRTEGPAPTPSAGLATMSKLDEIILSHLQHQHCRCERPISVLPPFSLLRPHVCPEARFEQLTRNAGESVCTRLLRRQSRCDPSETGSLHDRRLDLRFVHSRLRLARTLRDREGSTFTACAFRGSCQELVLGTDSGAVGAIDAFTGEVCEDFRRGGAHTGAVRSIQAAMGPAGNGRVLSSTASEVAVWSREQDSDLACYRGVCDGSFDGAGGRIVCPASHPQGDPSPKLLIFDLNSASVSPCLTLEAPRGALGSTQLQLLGWGDQRAHFGHGDTLVLWGSLLWDLRMPTPIHRFDRFTDAGRSRFHPNGLEILLNSEVWDLRTHKLLRTVPSLDGTDFAFSSSGEVVYAWRGPLGGGGLE